MSKTARKLAAASVLATLLLLIAPVAPAPAATIDGTVEWAGISHLPIQDRSPIVPLDGESFSVRVRTWRNDVEEVRVVHDIDGTPENASVVRQLAP